MMIFILCQHIWQSLIILLIWQHIPQSPINHHYTLVLIDLTEHQIFPPYLLRIFYSTAPSPTPSRHCHYRHWPTLLTTREKGWWSDQKRIVPIWFGRRTLDLRPRRDIRSPRHPANVNMRQMKFEKKDYLTSHREWGTIKRKNIAFLNALKHFWWHTNNINDDIFFPLIKI